MTDRIAKAVNTRRERLTKHFEAITGRPPTVEELNNLYTEEMKAMGSRSRRNPTGQGGFGSRTPEEMKIINEKSLKTRRGREIKETQN